MLSKTFYTATLLLGTAASFALADYAINTPGTGVVWNAGDSVKVLWGTSGNNVEPQVDVRLVKGPASNLQFVKNLCSNIDPTVGECDYTVESSLTSGRDYAIEVGKSPANYGYSSFFTIQATGELPQQSGCPNFGGQNCPSSLPCCSSAGYCGATDAYCGTGCMAQYSFNGVCVAPGATTTSTTSSADPVTTSSADPITTSSADPVTTSTTSSADPVTSATTSTTSAATSTTGAEASITSAEDPTTSVTSAAAQVTSLGGSYGPPYGQPGNGKGQFLNLDPMDPDFGDDLGETIHNYNKDIEKGIKNHGFGPKHKQPKRRRGILRL